MRDRASIKKSTAHELDFVLGRAHVFFGPPCGVPPREEDVMQFNRLGAGGTGAAPTVLQSRAAWAAGASVLVALAFGAPDRALAQCPTSYHASSGSGVHGTVNANAGVHAGASAPSGSTSSTSCPTGGTATNTHVVHASLSGAGLGVDRPTVHSKVAAPCEPFFERDPASEPFEDGCGSPEPEDPSITASRPGSPRRAEPLEAFFWQGGLSAALARGAFGRAAATISPCKAGQKPLANASSDPAPDSGGSRAGSRRDRRG